MSRVMKEITRPFKGMRQLPNDGKLLKLDLDTACTFNVLVIPGNVCVLKNIVPLPLCALQKTTLACGEKNLLC